MSSLTNDECLTARAYFHFASGVSRGGNLACTQELAQRINLSSGTSFSALATILHGLRTIAIMGRGRGGPRGGRFGRGDGRRSQHKGQRAPKREIVTENEDYQRYYDSLDLVPSEERETFWAALRRDLPNSFRFTGSKQHSLAVRDHLEEKYGPSLKKITFEGELVEPPKPVSWYPDQLAYSMNIGKIVLRKNQPFKEFHTWLVSETSIGSISRQELVSMIPPLLTDIRPGMTVLDMCAAPGSKTCQMIELLHQDEEQQIKKAHAQRSQPNGHTDEANPTQSAGFEDDGRTTSLMIANDKDWKRANMLIHQIKRLTSPNVIIMNHDASLMPSIRLPARMGENGQPQSTHLKFDRILADVPCSGDGTSRKNHHVWREWIPQNAIGLHNIQVRILTRAIQMLKVGGRVTYSTCSMNPVENEAVLLTAIAGCGPQNLKMVDCAEKLPTLLRRNGLSSWKVMDKDKKIWTSYQDAENAARDHRESSASRLTQSLFAPENPEEWQKDVIRHCIRVMAHQQDTGAFFIAVIEKTSEIKGPQKPQQPSALLSNGESSTPILDIANEIESKPHTVAGVQQHLKTVDALHLPDSEADPGIISAAETQNSDTLQSKRKIDEEMTQEPPAKKSRLEVDLLEAAGRHAEAKDDSLRSEIPNPLTDSVTPMQSMIPSAAFNTIDEPQPTQDMTAKLTRPEKVPYQEFFTFLPPTHPEIQLIRTFYSLSPTFPLDRFYVRNPTGEPTKAIYYCSAHARDILCTNNAQVGGVGGKAGLRFVHAGVKMFTRQDARNLPGNDSRWRIQSEGCPIIERYVTDARKVWCWRKSSFRALLKEMFVRIPVEGEDPDTHADVDGRDGSAPDLGEVGAQMRTMAFGCCILKVGPRPTHLAEKLGGPDEGEEFVEEAVYPVWRGIRSLNLMMSKDDRKAVLLREFEDTEAVQNCMVGKGRAERAAAEEEGEEEEEQDGLSMDVDGDADDDGINGAVAGDSVDAVGKAKGAGEDQ